VLQVVPPLTITEEQLTTALGLIEDALTGTDLGDHPA
jgi:hypothetical protein